MSKRLYRSGINKMLGGVAGGIAEYFDVDPVIVRVIFVVTLFTFGISLLIYLILWMIIPERPLAVILGLEEEEDNNSNFQSSFITKNSFTKKKSFGVLLAIVGAILLFDNVLSIINIEFFWSLALIAIGGYFILKN